MKDFFIVWNIEYGPPSYLHATLADAVKEAERLARDNPGQHFHVLGTLGAAHQEPAPSLFVKSLVNVLDEVPF